MQEEIWKPIQDYEGVYEISNFGRVKSLNSNTSIKEIILKQTLGRKSGYYFVVLCKDGDRKTKRINRLVAEAFIKNPEVNHKDTIKTNNFVDNLEWMTHKESIVHAHINNCITNIGENAVLAKLKQSEIFQLYKYGFSQRDIGRFYNVDHTSIGRVLNGKTFK